MPLDDGDFDDFDFISLHDLSHETNLLKI